MKGAGYLIAGTVLGLWSGGAMHAVSVYVAFMVGMAAGAAALTVAVLVIDRMWQAFH